MSSEGWVPRGSSVMNRNTHEPPSVSAAPNNAIKDRELYTFAWHQDRGLDTDVTCVGEYTNASGRKKKSINGNVLIELGYARGKLGLNKVITVQNTAFGTPDELPFDMTHLRHPVQFSVTAGTSSDNKDKQFQKLIAIFEDAFRDILKSVLATEAAKLNAEQLAESQLTDQALERVNNLRKTFENEVHDGNFGEFKENGPYITFRMIPLKPPKQLDIFSAQNWSSRLSMFLGRDGKETRPDSLSVFRRAKDNPSDDMRMSLLADGSIVSAQNIRAIPFPDYHNVVNYLAVERKLVLNTLDQIQLLRELGINGSIAAQFGLHNVKGKLLLYGERASFHGPFKLSAKDNVFPPAVVIPAGFNGGDDQFMATIWRPAFDWVWRSVGADRCLIFNPDGTYAFNSN